MKTYRKEKLGRPVKTEHDLAYDAGATDGFNFGGEVLPEEFTAYFRENDETNYGALRAAALFYMRNRGFDHYAYVDTFIGRAEAVIAARIIAAIEDIFAEATEPKFKEGDRVKTRLGPGVVRYATAFTVCVRIHGTKVILLPHQVEAA